MRILFSRLCLLFVVIAGIYIAPSLNAGGGKSTLRGWLSDEDCAGGRASSGTYTGTNPDCAKKCVRDGKRSSWLIRYISG